MAAHKRAALASHSRQLWQERTGAGPDASYLRELTSPDWHHRIDGPVYNVGGALVEYILNRHGVERFLDLYFASRPGQFESACRTHLGVELDTLEGEFWRAVERLAD
jgi:hypothetical protein